MNKSGRLVVRVAFVCYLFGLLYITMFAWNYGASLGPEGPGGRHYNLIPFRSIYRIAVFSPTVMDPLRILLGNILLFFPLGFLLPLVYPKLRSLLVVTLIGAGVSALIELYQFAFTMRVSDIDDLILNTAGVYCGVLLYFLLRRIARRIYFIF